MIQIFKFILFGVLHFLLLYFIILLIIYVTEKKFAVTQLFGGRTVLLHC